MPILRGEGARFAAHLVIGNVEKSGTKSGTHRCLLERMTGLSRSKVISCLMHVAESNMLDSARPKYEYTEKKSTIKGAATLRMSAYAEKSESLEDDVNEKELVRIQFLGRPKQTDNQGLAGIESLEEHLVAKVKSTHQKGDLARRAIESAIRFAKIKSYEAKLQFRHEDDGETKLRMREVDLDKSAFEDQLFARIEKLELEKDFSSVYTEIDREVVDAMRDILLNGSYWHE